MVFGLFRCIHPRMCLILEYITPRLGLFRYPRAIILAHNLSKRREEKIAIDHDELR